jgi:hypothetical protein
VEDGLSSYFGSRKQSAYLADSVKAAQRSVDLALLQYREGTVDYQRVLDTQQTRLRLQDSYTTVRGEAIDGLIAVYKALGGGWEIRADKPFVPGDRQRQMSERTDWGRLLDASAPSELPAPPKTGTAQPVLNPPQW